MNQRSGSFAHVRARATALTLAALAVATLTGCGSSGSATASNDVSSPTPSSAAPTASATVDPRAALKTSLLGTYTGFWDLQVKAYSTGSLDGLGPNKYAMGQAYYDIESTLQYYKQNNQVMRGRPVLSPHVSALNTSKKPYTATITDCIDTSNFLPINATTGKPVKLTSNIHRHPWTFNASYDNVQWRIIAGKIDRSRTC